MDAVPPLDSITWEREGSRYKIQYRDDPLFGILQKTVTFEDNGDWICHASAQFGGADTKFTVVVLGK